ncbi:PAS domain S-box protein [Pseudoduganella sp. DS3]|uniref:histidine kinase n=1 Tax=Pseudoduganella guangdongensis TaxID=2692179 RepID=A0A6N9HPV3_9BURK|nr:CHASE domain-containing protein [Pseudoduganella guangdongensis]MYN05514.1 PAS domain S-box protein [Pseudoduganella guangdongensis]
MRIHGYLAFIVGICVTVWVCMFVIDVQDRQTSETFQRDTQKISRDTQVRLQTYFDMLLSIKGVFAVDDDVSRLEFTRYVRELDLKRRYPGFQAIQFVRRVPAAQLEAYTARIRADDSLQSGGYPDYKVHPSSVRREHFLIEYNEPMKGNENAFGLDLAALPPHFQALQLGKVTGRVVATERITLVQDNSGQPGFVARAPIYKRGASLLTEAERDAALVGFVAIVFRVNDLMSEVIDSPMLQHMYISINDAGYLNGGGSKPPSVDNLMFDSFGKVGSGKRLPAVPGLTARVPLDVGERRWVMTFEGHEGERYGRDLVLVSVIGLAGFIISALIGAQIMTLQRRRALAQKLRVTADELRALQDSAIVGIGLIANGVIVRCNSGLEEMMGYKPGELTGRSSSVLTAGYGDPFELGPDGGNMHFELELAGANGKKLWCMVNGRMLDPKDARKGCVWVIIDITERKQAEAALVDTKHGLERSLTELALQKANVENAHKDLSAVLLTLKQAQASLITSEKMASLGALVAGIAHELNTPIGNSLLTATALSDMCREFERQLGEGGIKRSALDTHLKDARMACSIITNSLTRAADLIHSFKQVAVDQTADKRRSFNLYGVVHDTLATYSAQLRRANCEVKVNMPEALSFISYPGSVGQVLSNLIQNALMHAFEGREHGRITISVGEVDEHSAELRFADDGVGMNPRTLHQVYDPFFTTKMGQGGSGLGMNIVYNLVTGVLRGTIRIESEPGQGTTVILTLPRKVPAREELAEHDLLHMQ